MSFDNFVKGFLVIAIVAAVLIVGVILAVPEDKYTPKTYTITRIDGKVLTITGVCQHDAETFVCGNDWYKVIQVVEVK